MMKRIRWALGMFGLMGCSGNVDLGQANPPGPTEALGSKLRSFAAMPWGMCALLEDQRAYCWGRGGSTRAERVPNLDGLALASLTAGERVCAVRADGAVACAASYEVPLQRQLGLTDAIDISLGGGQSCHRACVHAGAVSDGG
jgi:hypothetical protein